MKSARRSGNARLTLRMLRASDDLFIEYRAPATHAACLGFSHRRILLCGAVRAVALQPSGLWCALVHRLNARRSDCIGEPPNSAGFFSSARGVALQAANATQGKSMMRKRQQCRSDKYRCHRPHQGHGPQYVGFHESLPDSIRYCEP